MNHSTTSANVLSVKAENIPAALRAIPRWIGWKAAARPGGKLDKIPVNPATGRVVNALDPSSWCNVDTAIAGMRRHGLSGVGFVLAEDDDDQRVIGVDFDHCVGADGKLTDEVLSEVIGLDSYTELSPSGTGVRVFALGGLPPGGQHKLGNVEMYDGGRFLTVTGHRFSSRPTDLQERDFELRDMHARLLQRDRPLRTADQSDTYPEDEPPVLLEKYDMRRWEGAQIVKRDGALDRSATLYEIGKMLARYGCNRWLIARSVRERDAALGYRKYCDRTDGGAKAYGDIAQRAWEESEQRAFLFGKTREERMLAARVAEAEQWAKEAEERAEKAEASKAQMEAEWEKVQALLQNQNLRPQERIVLMAAASEYQDRKRRGEVDADGYAEVYRQSIGKRAGCSEGTVGRCLKAADEYKLLEKKTDTSDRFHTRLMIRMDDEYSNVIEQASIVAPERPKHGGTRTKRCPIHGDAAVIERITQTCRDCGEIFKSETRIYDNDNLDGILVDGETLLPAGSIGDQVDPLCIYDDQLDPLERPVTSGLTAIQLSVGDHLDRLRPTTRRATARTASPGNHLDRPGSTFVPSGGWVPGFEPDEVAVG